MSRRILNFTALLCAYASISLSLSTDRLDMVLYGLPIVLATVVAAVPKWNSPRAISTVGLVAFVAVYLSNVDALDAIALALGAAQLVMVALYGLSLVVDPATRGRHALAGDLDVQLPAREVARAIVAHELKRSRRTRSPMSVLSLDDTASIEPCERHELTRALRRETRELDTLFVIPTGELAILCVATDRTGARRYGERLCGTTCVRRFSVASFPEDAVTLQGLFDLVSPSRVTSRSRTAAEEIGE